MQHLAAIASAYLSAAIADWRPWVTPEGKSPQRDFIRGARTHRTRALYAGNQVGKTEVLSIDTTLRLFGWHPFVRRQGAVRGWWSCLDWDLVGAIAWPKLKRWLPPGRWKAAWLSKNPEIPRSISIDNGSYLGFKSAEMGREKYQSDTLDFVCMDEEHPGSILEEIRARLINRGGDLYWGCTPINREPAMLELAGEPGTLVVRASTIDAARSGIGDLAAVQALADSLPDRQRRVRIEGEAGKLEGLVYPEFEPQVHVLSPREGHLVTTGGERRYPWPLPATWNRYASIDFGYSHATAIPFCSVDPGDGTVVVERCPYATGIRASRWAELIPELIPHRRLTAALFADPSAADQRAELAAKGIGTFAADNSILQGIESVERYLSARGAGRPKLYFVLHGEDAPRHEAVGRMDCHSLIQEIKRYQYPKQDGAGAARKDLPVKREDDAMDALRYLILHIEKLWGGPPTVVRGAATPPVIGRDTIWR